ncbi:toxin-antitoxin system, toxin component, HicA domain protein [Leptospira alstonii serovar Pingchang str. 80-412]|uniref:Toxin-antitoxin system, toxin component, HicA domain protein n=2 Tax=Leptospira alstonii TaxID=28452 RepID=M6CPH4_9LEPT|nr:type II toxin-antitoxin system HicA family toxin [Leptospira alstonii]EMJ93847.1 toxin-antitoxin system, toxin component, HicA domain protein [Leptospira alstonii serovar Sichuan str. 79601]EQA80310.1 toxin-antitoxin system, toxin component, HicA domain protein [Leptospira alstonii serovar Pingchang str. 80-412]
MSLRPLSLTAIVPNHKEIAIGTLRSILRQAQISVEDFANF